MNFQLITALEYIVSPLLESIICFYPHNSDKQLFTKTKKILNQILIFILLLTTYKLLFYFCVIF